MRNSNLRKIQGMVLIIFLLLLSLNSSSWSLDRDGMVGFGGTILTGLATGDFGSLVESGLGPGVNIEYFMNKSVAVGANFGYLLFQSPAVIQDSTLTQEWRMLSYGVFGKYIFNPDKEFSFYGKGGAMLNSYQIKYERVSQPVASDSSKIKDNTAQISAGLGITFDYKERLGLFAEFLYNRLLIKNLSVQFFGLNIGATLYFGGRKGK
ncbi:MAG: hypothetical protein RBG1_1C00001G0831 [candidate division Zixibacteria bacterium RBG-1]|nr:MAG: hypothetical protein RBG1_1C00001G0831 [candidate division Zixibacteria bacterium RBG-1]OGC83534.1 MAG: hypothetical protein A2V73_05925 [candidate division Zixibacteria bacterium RBG_19FT_COMBO_42_43]